MNTEKYYKILGIPKNATAEEIKRAYQKAANDWHPDKYIGNNPIIKQEMTEMFQQINEAYEALCLIKPVGKTNQIKTTRQESDPQKIRDKDKNAKSSPTVFWLIAMIVFLVICKLVSIPAQINFNTMLIIYTVIFFLAAILVPIFNVLENVDADALKVIFNPEDME